MAGAVFGEVALSLFVAGAALCDVLKLHLRRIALAGLCQRVHRIKSRGRGGILAQYHFVAGVALRGNMLLEGHFSWQAQYLVKFTSCWHVTLRGRRSIW